MYNRIIDFRAAVSDIALLLSNGTLAAGFAI